MPKAHPSPDFNHHLNPNAEIVSHLNAVLKHALTAINQHFLHARMLKHMGLMKLADYEYKESISGMKHADMMVERVLSLGGLPNLQDLGKLFIGEKVAEILICDLQLEEEVENTLKAALFLCKNENDMASAEMLQRMLESYAEHVSFIRTQLALVDSLGLAVYLESQR